MAAKTNTAVSAQPTRDELAAQLRNEIMAALHGNKIMAALHGNKSGISLTDRALNWGADKLADAGNGVAALGAGASAAVDNFSVTYATARLRQKQRTQAKIDALIEQQLTLAGL